MLKVVSNLKKATIVLVFALCFSALFALSLGEGAIAETRDVKTRVTIKPSLLLDIPSNNITMNLDPSSHAFEERDLTIKVGTNNLYGYKLFLTTPNDDTDLVNVADSSKTIPNLTSSTSVADFPVNNWGYRFTPNASSSTGNYGQLSSDSAPIMESTVPVNEQTSTLGFAAKIDYTKPSGLYNLKLNFKAVPTVTTNYMQDIAADPTLASTVCTEEPTVVIDKRDEQSYTIRRINGDCWMVENLQFTGTTMDSTTSNISPEYTPSNPYRVNGGNGYGELGTGDVSGSSYTEPKIHSGKINITNTPISSSVPSAEVDTVWYNYAAASAETITGESNTDPQLYDICPAGWKLPNDAEFTNVIDYQEQFNLVEGGSYVDGIMTSTASARWWSSNYMDNPTARSKLTYIAGVLSITKHSRPGGFYVRCVMKDTNIGNLTYMQDFATLNESSNAAKKTQVIDSIVTNQAYNLTDVRDTQTYEIKKLPNNSVWMTKNLAIGCDGTGTTYGSSRANKTLKPSDSNVSTNWSLSSSTVLSLDKTDNTTGCTTSDTSGCNSYTTARMKCSSEYGAWYDYITATAGNITGSENSNDETTSSFVWQDICPAGWKMPSTTDATPIKPYPTEFNISYASSWSGGSISSNVGSNGVWWITNATANPSRRAILSYASGNTNMSVSSISSSTSGASRTVGTAVRCVLK